MPKRDVEYVLDTFTDVVTQELVNNSEVVLAGFGAFSSRTRKGRIVPNPRKLEEKITVQAVKVAKFKPGKALKDTLKGKREARGFRFSHS